MTLPCHGNSAGSTPVISSGSRKRHAGLRLPPGSSPERHRPMASWSSGSRTSPSQGEGRRFKSGRGYHANAGIGVTLAVPGMTGRAKLIQAATREKRIARFVLLEESSSSGPGYQTFNLAGGGSNPLGSTWKSSTMLTSSTSAATAAWKSGQTACTSR